MIKREIFSKLQEHLHTKEITLLIGPRQAGKTTLMRSLQEVLQKNNEATVYLNLDNDADNVHFRSQDDFISYIKLQFGNRKGYVFIDEIQRKENAGLFLKGLYDRNLPYKLLVTGSGSIELKEKIHESLAGRKRTFEVMTVNFREFVNYKTQYQFQDRLKELFEIERGKTIQLLNEYLQYGGYPQVITSETHEEKLLIMQEIYTSYLEKDIVDLLHVQKTEAFNNLVTILSSKIGQLMNEAELSSTLSLDIETVSKYLWYLRKTFITMKISPYFRNVSKELVKTPVYYFADLGLRNFALNRLTSFNLLIDGGFLFQNLVALLLKADYDMYKLHYWRSKGGAEVDFILSAGIESLPLEVKFKDLENITVNKSITSYISDYHPKKFFILNRSLRAQTEANGTMIECLPYHTLLYSKL